jgi:hypothetical protein
MLAWGVTACACQPAGCCRPCASLPTLPCPLSPLVGMAHCTTTSSFAVLLPAGMKFYSHNDTRLMWHGGGRAQCNKQ